MPQADKDLQLLLAIVGGLDYHPGMTDLDDEQPVNVRMTLGDYRHTQHALWFVQSGLFAARRNYLQLRAEIDHLRYEAALDKRTISNLLDKMNSSGTK